MIFEHLHVLSILLLSLVSVFSSIILAPALINDVILVIHVSALLNLELNEKDMITKQQIIDKKKQQMKSLFIPV